MVPVHGSLPNLRAFVQNVERLSLKPELLAAKSVKASRMTLAEMREENAQGLIRAHQAVPESSVRARRPLEARLRNIGVDRFPAA
jgi:hypothetical protein